MQVRIPQGAFKEFTTEIIREAAADVPQLFGIGVDTIEHAALGAGGLGLALGAFKAVKVLLSKDAKPKVEQNTNEDAGKGRRTVLRVINTNTVGSDGKTKQETYTDTDGNAVGADEESMWRDGVRLAIEGKLPILGSRLVGLAIERYVYSRDAKENGIYLKRNLKR